MADELVFETSRRYQAATQGQVAKADLLPSHEPTGRVQVAARDEQTLIGRAIETYFANQARLPPAEMTGFDPRLSPAWAGLQIPR